MTKPEILPLKDLRLGRRQQWVNIQSEYKQMRLKKLHFSFFCNIDFIRCGRGGIGGRRWPFESAS